MAGINLKKPAAARDAERYRLFGKDLAGQPGFQTLGEQSKRKPTSKRMKAPRKSKK